MRQYIAFDSQIGRLTIMEENGKLISVLLDGLSRKNCGQEKETTLLEQARLEIIEYLNGKRKNFDLPIEMRGTDFQKKVWTALCEIPYGETISYKQLAQRVENPKAYRAVGGANNKNPLPIIVPCHRVIGSNGKLVGYAGGLGVKEKLLELERKYGIL